MYKHVLTTPFKLIGLTLGLAVTLWFINFQLPYSVLVISVEQHSDVKKPVYVFFKSEQDAPFHTQQIPQTVNERETLYFPLPKHFEASSASIVPQGHAADWTIYEIAVRSRFFIFDLDAYSLPLKDLQLSKDYPGSKLVRHEDSISFSGNNTKPVLDLALNDDSLSWTTELILSKLFYISVAVLVLYWLFGNHFVWSLITSRTRDYEAFKVSVSSVRKDQKGLMLVSGFLFVLVIVIFRFPLVAEPGILIEDAMEMSDVLSGVAHPLDLESYFYYRGYYVVLTEAIAQFSSWFPLAWQPSMYLWFGLLSMCTALCVFSYSGLFKSRLILLIAPIVFCLGAFTGPLMYLTITSVLFSSTVLLMAIAVRPAPNNNWHLFLLAVLVFILAWSGPYTPQLLPLSFALLLLHSSGKKNLILILSMVLAVLYTASAASGMVQLSNILDSNVRVALFDAIIQHIFLLELYSNASYTHGIGIICLIGLVLFCFRKDVSYVKHSLAFLGASLASIATYFISFKYEIYHGVLLDSHTVTAQFCWLVFLFLSADKLFSLNKGKRLNGVLSVCFCLAVVGFLYAKDQIQKKDYELLVEKRVPSFLKAIEQAQEIALDDNEFLQLWYINQFKQVVSVYFGDTSLAAKTTDLKNLPESVQRFAIPFSLDRDLNNVLYYKPIDNTIGYSHTGREKKLPKWDKP